MNLDIRRFILPLLIIAGGMCYGQIRLPKVIGNNMVLQQKQQLPIWGWATPGMTLTIKFGNQTVSAIAGKDSSWRVNLAPLEANWTPQNLSIELDNKKIILSNILVGEVWLCSGQSNMEYPMNRGTYKAPLRGADSAALALLQPHSKIRLFNIKKKLSFPDVTSTGWSECNGEAFEKASAAGYFFAKEIQAKLNVPVGIITSAWGGSRIESWTPEQAYKGIKAFSNEVKADQFAIDNIRPGKNFASMIAPLSPFAIKGVLWYQGESNCMIEERNMRYASKMQALIESWRSQWKMEDLPFYYVLIAPYHYTKRKEPIRHTIETLPLFWEQQIAASQIPHTGFVTTTDLVDGITEIHPSYKWEVGRRLAWLALNKTYQKKVDLHNGPQFKRSEVRAGKIILHLNNANGLRTRDGEKPNCFTISGKDGVFLSANASIEGQTIVLSHPDIKKPRHARFAWSENARPNLINKAGFPAIPFRTDSEKWKYPSK